MVASDGPMIGSARALPAPSPLDSGRRAARVISTAQGGEAALRTSQWSSQAARVFPMSDDVSFFLYEVCARVVTLYAAASDL